MSKPLTVQDYNGRELPVITLDFETYYEDSRSGYSLKNPKINTIMYVRDPRFKAHGLSYVLPDGTEGWVTHKNLKNWFASFDWTKHAMLGMNTSFDAFIAFEHYGIDAAYYLDIMSMSRGEWGIKERASLQAISKRLGMKGKLEGELEKTSGIRDLSPEQEAELIPYALQDSRQTLEIFEHMYFEMGFPEDELHIIDLTIRAASVPKLRINAALCHAEIEDEDRRLKNLLESDIIGDAILSPKCGQKVLKGGVAELMRSRPCFAELIKSRGVMPPMKHAKTAKGEFKYDEDRKPIYTYAFAKNDIELMNLGEDERVSDLVAVWTGLKSTIRKTRAQTFLNVTHNGAKTLPIPLNYCGAHTMRWSGGENLNPQNLPSGRDGRGARLRESIIAPDGYVIVVSDSAQIEARVNATLWGQEDLIQTFRDKKDPYSELASSMYKVPVGKNGPNSHLRPVGKAMELGLGYGMGVDRFLDGCLSGSITGDVLDISYEEAATAVEFYRHRRNKIVEGWDKLKQVLAHMVSWDAQDKANGVSLAINSFLTAAPDRIIMPNGLSLHYKNLGYHYFPEKEKRELVYESGRDSTGAPSFTRLWHSKLDENIVQCLSRIIVAQQAVAVARRYDVVLLVHDEIVYLAKEEEAEEALEFGLAAMRVPPVWMPDLPLDAEGGTAKNYSK